MNIAIYTLDFQWAGGIDFLHGLVKGLLSQTERKCNIFILVHDPSIRIEKTFYRSLVDVTKRTVYLARNPSQIKFSRPKITEGVTSNYDGHYDQISNIKEIFSSEKVEIVYYNDYGLESKLTVLRKIKADIVLPVLMNAFPKNFPVPWVGYLFDFVYKYHTHLYTKDFCLQMDIRYATTLLEATSVLVNSRATYNDLFKFFPYAKAKVFDLPFAPYTNEYFYNAALLNETVTEKHKIKKRYFMISNQFWLHKSHETAFEALKILQHDLGDPNIEIVCTGKMSDLTGTDERKIKLREFVEKMGMGNYIHFLGHIPKVDQLALMLRSEAVLQPTLFEGGPGGGSVYMAIANGVKAIVSDIEVNKEINNEPLIRFFKAADARDLASKMRNALDQRQELLPYAAIHKKNEDRLKLLGNRLIECMNYTIGVHHAHCH